MQLGRTNLKNVPIRVAPLKQPAPAGHAGRRHTWAGCVVALPRRDRSTVSAAVPEAARTVQQLQPEVHDHRCPVSSVPQRTLPYCSVWKPSPAWSAGLKQGAEILAVNHVSTEAMTVKEFTSRIHGSVGNGGKALTVQGREGVEEVWLGLQDLACGAATAETQ